MNTVERIVACYFQMVRRCLTASDVKVPPGNNRQFDLLACVRSGDQYHIEAGVTNELNWCPTLPKTRNLVPSEVLRSAETQAGTNTDHAKKKRYLRQIRDT